MRQILRGHNVWLNVVFDVAGPALEHICSQRLLYPREVQATVIAPLPKEVVVVEVRFTREGAPCLAGRFRAFQRAPQRQHRPRCGSLSVLLHYFPIGAASLRLRRELDEGSDDNRPRVTGERRQRRLQGPLSTPAYLATNLLATYS